MPLANWNVQFLNHNSQRRYPLADDASGADATGSFKLPNSFLVALDLPVHYGLTVDPSRFFLRQIGVYPTGFSLLVAYQPAAGDPVNVASATIPRSAHVENTTYALGGINDFADTIGKVTVGSLDEIDEQPSGLFTFALAGGRIEPDAVRPMLRYVSAITVRSGTDRSERLYGDVELVAGENVQLTPIVIAGQDPQIRISAIEGEGLAEDCVCEGDDEGPPIRRINGIPPTAAGDFSLLGNECLVPNGVQNGIRLDDVCSQPCCGCQELEAITRDLERFGSQATTLENFLVRLESRVTTMDQIVLGSKLSDRGCISCG